MKQEVATVGLDLAKNVFQVHAISSDGAALVRRKLRRAEVIVRVPGFVSGHNVSLQPSSAGVNPGR